MEEGADIVSEGEYLRQDREFDGKLELLNGVVVAMAGAGPRHNLIVGNLFAAVHTGLAGRPCLAFTQDQRVQLAATESYVYPDIVVVCGDPSFETGHRPPTLLNPTAVVEVLSESTLSHDLGAKLRHYRRHATIDEIVFVHADQRLVTSVTRQDDGSWRLIDSTEGSLTLAGVSVGLDALYAGSESVPL